MSLIINWWNIVVLALGLIATFWCNNKYNETKSRPLLTSLPGVWTSLGLLGTFLAICLSLHDVKTAEGVNADILELIRSLVPAFTTSIIGLVGALVVTIWSNIIRKTKCSRIFKRSVQSSKTKCPLSRREDISFQV